MTNRLSLFAIRYSPFVCLISLLLIGLVLKAEENALQNADSAFHKATADEAEWVGDWEFSELGADPSQSGSVAGSDRVTIPFTGTDLALRVRRGGYRAYLWVSVDGQPANRLPRTERGAYLVLSSPDYEPQVTTIPVAEGLEEGPHIAEIVADRGWDQWPLVGWRVSHRADTTVYRWASTGLGLLALACVICAAITWERSEPKPTRLPIPQSPFSNLHSPFSILHSPFSILHSPFSILHSPFSILHSPISILLAALFYFSPWLPLTLISGLALAVLIVLRIDLGLALVALSAPFYLHPRSLLGKSFSMAEISILLCLLSWGIREFYKLKDIPVRNLQSAIFNLRPAPSAIAFALIAVVSVIFAQHRHVALRELRVVVLEPLIFYLMLRTVRLDEKAIWRIVDAFALGAVIVALIGLAQYALGVNIITAEQGFRRLRSIYGSPNNAALYLGRALPLLVSVGVFGRGRRRFVYAIAALPVALAALLTFSRGAILLGIPLSLLALGLLAGRRWRWATLGVVVAVAIGLIPLLRTPRFAAMLDPHSGTLFFRLQLWRASWMMVRDHLWLGVGPDNFLYQYRGRYILPNAWQEPHLSHAHNFALSYATRLGIIGLTVGLWLQVTFWRSALPLRKLGDPNRRALALGLMGSMVSFLAHGLVDASYFFPDLALAFFLTLGLVEWLCQSKRRRVTGPAGAG